MTEISLYGDPVWPWVGGPGKIHVTSTVTPDSHSCSFHCPVLSNKGIKINSYTEILTLCVMTATAWRWIQSELLFISSLMFSPHVENWVPSCFSVIVLSAVLLWNERRVVATRLWITLRACNLFLPYVVFFYEHINPRCVFFTHLFTSTIIRQGRALE